MENTQIPRTADQTSDQERGLVQDFLYGAAQDATAGAAVTGVVMGAKAILAKATEPPKGKHAAD